MCIYIIYIYIYIYIQSTNTYVNKKLYFGLTALNKFIDIYKLRSKLQGSQALAKVWSEIRGGATQKGEESLESEGPRKGEESLKWEGPHQEEESLKWEGSRQEEESLKWEVMFDVMCVVLSVHAPGGGSGHGAAVAR